jgi:serine/threonine-protein kinase
MGEVFLAEDTTLDRKVAIKMLSETLAGHHSARQRLINEAKAAAALDHPNICSIYEVGEEDGHVFIVMQQGRRLSAHGRSMTRRDDALR